MPRRGRPQKPYETSWGEIVPGLTRCTDGRWRISATDYKFTEHDERRAVNRAKNILDQIRKQEMIDVAVEITPSPVEIRSADDSPLAAARRKLIHKNSGEPLYDRLEVTGDSVTASQMIDPAILWPWLREQLIARPDWVAERVAIPELAGLARFDIPRASIKLTHLRDLYRQHADVKDDTKREACKTFDHFLSITGARVLADLTVTALANYRNEVKRRTSNPSTIGAYFGRVKWIVAFGKTEGEDAKEIDAALSRMAILKTPKDPRVFKPTPISREDFHAIYKKAGDLYPEWQPRLLAMLNLCLHFDEALDLEWSDFDLAAGTFCTARNKRGRVIRAAMLWPEFVEHLKRIKRTSLPHVFVSNHGTRYSAKGQWKTWNKLRIAAGCSSVQMDDIRDGAYSAACRAHGVEEKFARLLAGHRSHGIQDAYVARNPAMVKPACDAVYEEYVVRNLGQ